MSGSKEEARIAAYKKLRDEAEIRAKAAETRAAELESELKTIRPTIVGMEARLARYSDQVTRLMGSVEDSTKRYVDQAARISKEAEGAKADLLATTRRAIMDEILLKDLDERAVALKSALECVAEWPGLHSSEAKAMREVARKALREDRTRLRPPSP